MCSKCNSWERASKHGRHISPSASFPRQHSNQRPFQTSKIPLCYSSRDKRVAQERKVQHKHNLPLPPSLSQAPGPFYVFLLPDKTSMAGRHISILVYFDIHVSRTLVKHPNLIVEGCAPACQHFGSAFKSENGRVRTNVPAAKELRGCRGSRVEALAQRHPLSAPADVRTPLQARA